MFHVYARGNRKADIFVDDWDRERYVALLGAAVARWDWAVLAYCLMPNHVHLVLRIERVNLGRGMQALHGDYARLHNVRHGLTGHLFQGRYGAVRITDDEQLATTVGYVATNPVAAGLVRSPGDWRWGSHRGIERDEAPAWLAAEELFAMLAGAHGAEGRRRYDDLVAARGVTVSTSDVTTGAKSDGASVVL